MACFSRLLSLLLFLICCVGTAVSGPDNQRLSSLENTQNVSGTSLSTQLLSEMFALDENDFDCNNATSSENCEPAKYSESERCSYVKSCCDDTIEVGLMDYLTFLYCTMSGSLTWLGVVILVIFVLYAFAILGNVADDCFAPIMGEIADTLGVSHNVAGVTFLAFGNGAPDISSSITAIGRGGNQTLLGIGALLGAAVFDPIAVSGVIATVCDNPKVARRPLLRDCFFLCVAAAYVLFITEDGKVSILEASSMWIIYIFYVAIVVVGEAYKKWAKQQRRKKRQARREQLEREQLEARDEVADKVADLPKKESMIDRIMPRMRMFSNESARDLFAAGNLMSPDSADDTPDDDADLEPDENEASGAAVGAAITPMDAKHLQATERLTKHAGGNLSAQEITFGSHQLYHKLQEQDEERRQRWKKHSLASTVSSSSVASLASSSDASDDMGDRPMYLKILLYIVRAPTLLVHYMCMITVPMTDKNWNDKLAIICSLTGPVFTLYAFGLTDVQVDMGSVDFPLWGIVLILSLIPCGITLYLVRRKYEIARIGNDHIAEKSLKPSQLESLQQSLLEGGLQGNNNNKKKKQKKELPIEKQCVFKIYFLLIGFLAAVGWINAVANELVNLLTTLGVISTINLDILGLTVLAWGNSIGDMIADVSVSKRGYSKMGIGAAIGGPTLNVLIGVGLGFAIKTLESDNGVVTVPSNGNTLASSIGVLVGMVVYAIVVPLSGWKLTKWFGYWCFFYYALFLIINILVVVNVF